MTKQRKAPTALKSDTHQNRHLILVMILFYQVYKNIPILILEYIVIFLCIELYLQVNVDPGRPHRGGGGDDQVL